MTRFDRMLGAVSEQQKKESEPVKQSGGDCADFWEGMNKAERKATIKLSVSVPLALNEKIEHRAKEHGVSKNELINKMLEYLLAEH